MNYVIYADLIIFVSLFINIAVFVTASKVLHIKLHIIQAAWFSVIAI